MSYHFTQQPEHMYSRVHCRLTDSYIEYTYINRVRILQVLYNIYNYSQCIYMQTLNKCIVYNVMPT